jgi:hypothetical protein
VNGILFLRIAGIPGSFEETKFFNDQRYLMLGKIRLILLMLTIYS